MSPLLKRILLILAAAAGLVALVAIALVLFVDADRYKPRLEAAATEALGMEVRFGGRLRLGLLPGVHLTAEDARVRDERDSVVASAKRLRFGLALLPLIRLQLRLGSLQVLQPRLAIERTAEGTLNVERLAKAVTLLGMLDGASVSASDGTLLYADAKSGRRIEATGFGLTVKRMRLANEKGAGLLKGLSVAAEIRCREIRTQGFSASDLKASIHGKDGVVRFAPVTMGLFGGKGTGNLTADFSGAAPRYELRCALPRFRVEQFLAMLSPQGTAAGAMDFTASLSMQGATATELLEAATGEIALRGADLTLVGSDLDRALGRFESSQSFNLVDVGAVLLAGPMGLAVTRGYGLASLFRGSGGRTDIRSLVSVWRIEGGVAHAQDVALATGRNRLALKGGLDFVHGRFADMTLAALDAEGCAKVRQEIRGELSNPVVEKPRFFTSLAGPVMKVYRQTKGLLPGKPCEAFYSGSVPPPK